MRFLQFASVEYKGVIYMTPQDFLESVTEEMPRRRSNALVYIFIAIHYVTGFCSFWNIIQSLINIDNTFVIYWPSELDPHLCLYLSLPSFILQLSLSLSLSYSKHRGWMSCHYLFDPALRTGTPTVSSLS